MLFVETEIRRCRSSKPACISNRSGQSCDPEEKGLTLGTRLRRQLGCGTLSSASPNRNEQVAARSSQWRAVLEMSPLRPNPDRPLCGTYSRVPAIHRSAIITKVRWYSPRCSMTHRARRFLAVAVRRSEPPLSRPELQPDRARRRRVATRTTKDVGWNSVEWCDVDMWTL